MNADPDELHKMIKHLGFANIRTRRIIDMSRAYVEGNWSTPMDLPGCGKYATDSWLIFCKGVDVDVNDLTDKELRRYIRWKTTGHL